MVATIHGKYLSTMNGKTKNGKDWVCTRLLVGDDVVLVFGADYSSRCKQYDDVSITVNIFAQDNRLNVRVPKGDRG